MLRVQIWALCQPYCSTEVEARWFCSARLFRLSVHSGIDVDLTEKREL